MSNSHGISAEEWQLLTFFEVEPIERHEDTSWPFNTFIYRRRVGDVTVIFSIAPSYKDFTLTIERAGTTEIELTYFLVFDIRYHEDRQGEMLEILLTESDRLELRLKPSFSLIGTFQPQAKFSIHY